MHALYIIYSYFQCGARSVDSCSQCSARSVDSYSKPELAAVTGGNAQSAGERGENWFKWLPVRDKAWKGPHKTPGWGEGPGPQRGLEMVRGVEGGGGGGWGGGGVDFMESLLIPTNWQCTSLNNGAELITFVTTPASVRVRCVQLVYLDGGWKRGGGGGGGLDDIVRTAVSFCN